MHCKRISNYRNSISHLLQSVKESLKNIRWNMSFLYMRICFFYSQKWLQRNWQREINLPDESPHKTLPR